jgi:hypothetical protein
MNNHVQFGFTFEHFSQSLVQVRNSLLGVVICWPVAWQNFLTLNTIPTFTCGIQKSVYMYMSVPQFHLHDFIIMSPLRTKGDLLFLSVHPHTKYH